MSSFPENRRSVSIFGLIIPAAVIVLILVAMPFTGHSRDFTVVGGIVERVYRSEITLAAGTYDIGQARLRKPSGEVVNPSEIARGRKVDLYLRRGRVESVIVYPALMVE